MHPNLLNLIGILTQNPNVQFATFLYETVESKEVAELKVILGASTVELYKRDITTLNELLPTLSGLEKKAALELLESRTDSLNVGVGNNWRYTQADTWEYPIGLEKYGIRVHKDNGSLQISGLVQEKLIHIVGTYPPDTRRPFTKIKDAIRRQLPSHKFRTYRLDHVAGIRANGITLEFDNVITQTV